MSSMKSSSSIRYLRVRLDNLAILSPGSKNCERANAVFAKGAEVDEKPHAWWEINRGLNRRPLPLRYRLVEPRKMVEQGHAVVIAGLG